MMPTFKPVALVAACVLSLLPCLPAQAQAYVFNDKFDRVAGSSPDPGKRQQQTGTPGPALDSTMTIDCARVSALP